MKRVETYLNQKISEKGCIHIALIDPDKCDPAQAPNIATEAKKVGTDAFMVGGSTSLGGEFVDNLIRGLKRGSDLPTILFPGSLFGISKFADAVWFMSVLNSTNPYYITGAQAIGSRMVKAYNVEAIPLGYIIISPGGTAGFISQVNAVPYDKPEAAAIYALAAQYMGMRFVYLERGSGVDLPITPTMVKIVKKLVNESKIVVGGGIRTKEQAREIAQAGADAIDTGTVIEEKGIGGSLREINTGIEDGVQARQA